MTGKIRKIVVGVNETPAAVHALREAARIAEAADADLTVLTVVENPWLRLSERDVVGLRSVRSVAPADLAAANALESLERLVSSTIGQGHATLAVRFGLPHIELARWAELLHADLLILGRQPVSELARRPAGRTIAGTLARARMPCLLIPYGQRTWRRVLGATGRGVAGTAVDNAAREFAALWHEVPQCVHARASETEPAEASADPVGHVLKAARDMPADTLVFGFHRGETAAEWGRTAPQLMERAPCAVLTVPV